MEKELLQYGVLGIVVIGMAYYILKIEARHKRERKELMDINAKQFDRVSDMNDESNKVLRENTNILSGLKALLENRRYDK